LISFSVKHNHKYVGILNAAYYIFQKYRIALALVNITAPTKPWTKKFPAAAPNIAGKPSQMEPLFFPNIF